jgi:hypothetical protein
LLVFAPMEPLFFQVLFTRTSVVTYRISGFKISILSHTVASLPPHQAVGLMISQD